MHWLNKKHRIIYLICDLESENYMRKVILYIATSMDGFIADKFGNVNWIKGQDESYESDYGYSDFMKNIDTVILGYNTYKQITEELSPNEWVYEELQSYVFTKKEIPDKKNIKFKNENISSFITELKKQNGKNIWICGGSDILNQLVKDNVIDEYQITTIPIILGNGIKLFQANNITIQLKLEKSIPENGVITSIYSKR